jgi:CRISPR-associated endonuclease Cas1
MPTQTTSPLAYASKRGAVCVADGYRVSVRVRHGRLIMEDGFGPDRRRREYTRVTNPIARLIVVSGGGSVSFEALAWLRDVGAAFVHLSRDGRLVATGAPETTDPRLRRAQALAGQSEAGVELARTWLRRKLEGQHAVLVRLAPAPPVYEAFQVASDDLVLADTINTLVMAERDAALAYWAAWSEMPIRFRRADRERLPVHWSTFGQRTSPLTSAPRLAVNPANAVLNYLYALLEAETRIALFAVGLDPAVGIVHADVRGRDSLALDVMETVRPEIDRHLLDLLKHRGFDPREFIETRRGDCRILPPLTHELGETTERWAKLVAPVAEETARALAEAPGSRIERVPTPLTSSNRRLVHGTRRHLRAAPKPTPPCKRCGRPVPHPDRVYCDVCGALPQSERYASTLGLAARRPKVDAPARSPVSIAPSRTKRRCKRCGERVSHRKRVLCDSCFIAFRQELAAQRRPCKGCGEPVPHRKRALCDRCLKR